MSTVLDRIRCYTAQLNVEQLVAFYSKSNIAQIAVEVLIASVTPDPPPITDTILTGTATASGGTNPNNVLDGDNATYWYLTASVPDDWIYIDFGSVKSIGKYYFYQHDSYRAYTMKIQKSDDAITWTDIEEVSIGTELTSTFSTPQSCRYIRFYGLTGYSRWRVYTIEVYEVVATPKPVISQVAIEALYECKEPNINVASMCLEVLWSGEDGAEESTGAQTTSYAYVT